MNPRRGDLVGIHHLFCDAVEGLPGWFKDDSQIVVFGPNEEFLCQDFSGFAVEAEVL